MSAVTASSLGFLSSSIFLSRAMGSVREMPGSHVGQFAIAAIMALAIIGTPAIAKAEEGSQNWESGALVGTALVTQSSPATYNGLTGSYSESDGVFTIECSDDGPTGNLSKVNVRELMRAVFEVSATEKVPCESIKRINVIGENVTELPASVFSTVTPSKIQNHMVFSNLEVVDLSETSIAKIGTMEFMNDIALSNVVYPEVQNLEIENNAFMGCTACSEMVLPASVEKLVIADLGISMNAKLGDDEYQLSDISTMGLVSYSDDGRSIVVDGDFNRIVRTTVWTVASAVDSSDLTNRDAVENVTISEGITSLPSVGEFQGFTALKSVTLPASLSGPIPAHSFRGCAALKELDLSNTQIEEISDSIMQQSGVETLKLPKTLKSIGNGAFWNCPLKTIVFPEDSALETINNAFYLTGIEEIAIPDSVKTIGASAFMNCQSLKSVSLPATVESVDTNAFEGSNLFLSEGELIVRDTCAIPAALKDKNFTSVVKPALEHSFTTYGVAEPAEGAEAPEGLVLHRACAVCGELDPDAEDVSVDELLKQMADEAAAEVAQAACEAAGIAYDASKSAEENVAAAKAAVEQSAAEEATAKAAAKAAQGKADNPMTVKAKVVKAKAKKKTTIKQPKAFQVAGAKGALTFAKLSGSAKVIVSKAGKVTVKKGLKKGKTYKVKVLVCDAGNKDYAPAFKTVTLKVKVK